MIVGDSKDALKCNSQSALLLRVYFLQFLAKLLKLVVFDEEPEVQLLEELQFELK